MPTMQDVVRQSALIVPMIERRNAGQFKTVASAIALQKAQRERNKLRRELGPLRLVA